MAFPVRFPLTSAGLRNQVYFIDDETAIRVDGNEMDIVSEGRWRFHP